MSDIKKFYPSEYRRASMKLISFETRELDQGGNVSTYKTEVSAERTIIHTEVIFKHDYNRWEIELQAESREQLARWLEATAFALRGEIEEVLPLKMRTEE